MLSVKVLNHVDAIVDLQSRGFDHDFTLTDSSLYCSQGKYVLNSFEFDLMEMHYFPCRKGHLYERIVYGIYSPKHRVKGILLIKGRGERSVFPEMINRKLQENLMHKMRLTDHVFI